MLTPTFHVIDFEGHPGYGVIEYGVVTVADGAITAVDGRLCAPVGGIPARDSAVHGLIAGDLRGVAPLAEDYARFVQWRKTGQLTAHNAAFEHRLLRHTWPFPPAVPDWDASGQACADWGPWLDTVIVAREVWPDLPSYGLSALVNAVSLSGWLAEVAAQWCPPQRRKPHCALYDALASAGVLLAAWAQGWRPQRGNPQGELF